MSASEHGGVSRVLVMVVLGLALAAFLGFFVDTAVPAPADPYGTVSTKEPSPEQLDAFQKRREAIDAKLASGEITEDEANSEWTAIDDEEAALYDGPSEAAFAEYEAASTSRSRTVAFIDIGLVMVLWAAAVSLRRMGVVMADVPLLGGALLGILAAWQTVGIGSDRWMIVGVTGALTLAAVAVGGLVFGFGRAREIA
jgi:hypothetical protein